LLIINCQLLLGLTGFDSGQKWFVSMQCVVRVALKSQLSNYNWRK